MQEIMSTSTTRASLSEIHHRNILTPQNSKQVPSRKAGAANRSSSSSSSSNTFDDILLNPPPISKLAAQLAAEQEPGSASSADSQEENRAVRRSRTRSRKHVGTGRPVMSGTSSPTVHSSTERGGSPRAHEDSDDPDKRTASPSIFSFPPTSSPESDNEPPSVNDTDDSVFAGKSTAETDAGVEGSSTPEAESGAGTLDPVRRAALETEKRQLLQERTQLLQRLQVIERRVLLIDGIVSHGTEPELEVDYDAEFGSDASTGTGGDNDNDSSDDTDGRDNANATEHASPGIGVYWSTTEGADVQIPNISSFDAGDEEDDDEVVESDDDEDELQADRDRARINQSLQQLEQELKELKERRARDLAAAGAAGDSSAASSPAHATASDVMSGEEEEEEEEEGGQDGDGDVSSDSGGAEDFAANTVNLKYVQQQGLEPVMLDTVRFAEQREALRKAREQAHRSHLDEVGIDEGSYTRSGNDDYGSDDDDAQADSADASAGSGHSASDAVAAEAAELMREAAVEVERMQELSGSGNNDSGSGVEVEDISADEAETFLRMHGAGAPQAASRASREEVLEKHRELQREAQRLWQAELDAQKEAEDGGANNEGGNDDDTEDTSSGARSVTPDFAANTLNLKYVEQQGLEPVMLNTMDFARERDALRKERELAMKEHVEQEAASLDNEDFSAASVAEEAAELMREAVKEAEKLNKGGAGKSSGPSSPVASTGGSDKAEDKTWRLFQSEAIKSMGGAKVDASTDGAAASPDGGTGASAAEPTPPVFAQLIGMGFDEVLAREADARHSSNYFEALKWILAETRRRESEQSAKDGATNAAADSNASVTSPAAPPEPLFETKVSSNDDAPSLPQPASPGPAQKTAQAYVERTNIFKSLSPAVIARARAAAANRRQQTATSGAGGGGANNEAPADHTVPGKKAAAAAAAAASASAPEVAASAETAREEFVPPTPVFDNASAGQEEQDGAPDLPEDESAEERRRSKDIEDTLAAAQAAARALQRQREREANSVQRRADMFKVQGNDLYRKGHYAAAVAAYTSAVDLVSDNQIYWANRAAAKMMLFEYEGAIDDCAQAMSLPLPVGKPFYVKPYIRSGRAHLALGHADAAREQFEMALQEISVAKGSGRGADVADDEESARKGLEHCRKYTSYCRAASLKLKMKEYHAGLSNAQEALAIAGGSWEARCLVASAYITIRQFARCAEFCEGYLPESWVKVGQSSSGNRKGGDSPTTVPASGRRDADAELGIRYSKALHYQGYYCQAMDVLREVIRDLSNASVGNAARGSSGGVSHAQSELQKMETMMRRHDNGNRYYRNEKYEEAFREYAAALQLDPLNNAYCAVVYANRAAAALALKRFDRAISDCTESLRRRPNMSKAQYRRARAYVHTREYQKAIDDFEVVQRSELACSDIGRELREAKILLQNEQRERARQAEAEKTKAKLAAQRRRQREQREREKKEAAAAAAAAKERARQQREQQTKAKAKAENPYSRYGYGPRYANKNTGSSARTGSSAYGTGAYAKQQARYGRGGWQQQQQPKAQPSSKPKTANDAADAPHRDMRGPRKNDNFYQVLGLTRSATKVQIKKAYHKLALKFHPDKNAGSPRTASEKFKLVNEAYSTLSDASLRKKYDYKLRYGFEF